MPARNERIARADSLLNTWSTDGQRIYFLQCDVSFSYLQTSHTGVVFIQLSSKQLEVDRDGSRDSDVAEGHVASRVPATAVCREGARLAAVCVHLLNVDRRAHFGAELASNQLRLCPRRLRGLPLQLSRRCADTTCCSCTTLQGTLSCKAV